MARNELIPCRFHRKFSGDRDVLKIVQLPLPVVDWWSLPAGTTFCPSTGPLPSLEFWSAACLTAVPFG
jgi:hypothetical protein